MRQPFAKSIRRLSLLDYPPSSAVDVSSFCRAVAIIPSTSYLRADIQVTTHKLCTTRMAAIHSCSPLATFSYSQRERTHAELHENVGLKLRRKVKSKCWALGHVSRMRLTGSSSASSRHYCHQLHQPLSILSIWALRWRHPLQR
jgi:hypothetical protein